MIINVVFTILMLALAVWDLRSFIKNEHKDFKSLIMSIGILGTFVGIFIGLLGFDTKNLLDSVPTLLDGLKTAFYTSIVGMGIAIALSIYQKGKQVKEEHSPIDFIANQSLKFDELMYLRELTKLNPILETLHNTINKQDNFKTDIKTMLQDIDTSLHKALETLALGASKELIRALEIVISDFNSNLKEQFGENFKELNHATKNILEWQKNYKEHIEQNTQFLIDMQQTLKDAQIAMQQSTESILTNKIHLEEMQAYNKQNSTLQQQLQQALEHLLTLESSFEEKLKAVASLKDSSLEALEHSKNFIVSLTQSKDDLHEYLKKYQDKVLEFFEDNLHRLSESNNKLIVQNQNIVDSLQDSHHKITQIFESTNTKILESFQQTANFSNDIAQHTQHNLEQNAKSLLLLGDNLKQNADSMLEKLYQNTQQSLESMDSIQQKSNELYNEKFELLNDNLSKTMQTFHDELHRNTEGFKNFTKECLHNLEQEFHSIHDNIQESLTQNHQTITSSIENLCKEFQTIIMKDYETLQEKILNISNTAMQKQQESLNVYFDSTTQGLNYSIESQAKLTNTHIENLTNMQQNILAIVQENIETTKHFLTQSQKDNLNNLENLHNAALNKIESASLQTTQNTIDNLQDLQATYRENIESDIKLTNTNLQAQINTLKNNIESMLQTTKNNLETQHNMTTNSITTIMQESQHYFQNTENNFQKLIQEQYEKLQHSFQNHTKDLDSFLMSQTQNLTQNLQTQNQNLYESFNTQTEALRENLTQKGEILHEFLQTQTTSLDTNLQQMLSKFNKMLEHNYVNLSEMLEKDNTLIVRSLNSQAINLSNTLIESQQKIDSHLYTSYTKFSDNTHAIMESLSKNTHSLTSDLNKNTLEVQYRFQELLQMLENTHTQSNKLYEEKLQNTLKCQETIMQNLENKSKIFYDNMYNNLDSLKNNFELVSQNVQKSCEAITRDLTNQTQDLYKEMQRFYKENQHLSAITLKENTELMQKYQDNIATHIESLNDKLHTQFKTIMQSNQETLDSLGKSITHFSQSIQNFESHSKNNVDSLNTYFKNLCVQYIKLMQASMQNNIKNQKDAALEINNAILSIKENIKTLTDSNCNLFDNQKTALNEVIVHFKENIESLVQQSSQLQENLGNNLETLDSKLEKMTQSFAKNYEWFLKRIKDIINVN
ncbi:hypothetical protein CQA66_07350 [Helicobacter aurati]|uniref:MotA/TolQ/ExbB proton channel domain-containing protein n=1 Tax=Helicobacter aurati TaxID=137778 RepID=A0A3D8J0F5_9HELI|nr:hypothetical protein [Helicobacter aurati]RDU71022.1 hypothetical protein CQA66_07350 [Helicobacter aurati]